MTADRIPTVSQLEPMVVSAIRSAGRSATTVEIRDRVGASLGAEQLVARHRGGSGSEVAYRLRWAILDLRRRGVIERVAPRTYAITAEER